jgi:uncharacterized protein YdaU (DUF1376 family)
MKMKAMWFFCDDWIADTRNLTPQQRGIFIDLLCYSHGKGLPNDIDELCRMVINYVPDLAKLEELKKDVLKIIQTKYTLVDNRYVNLRQQEEYNKGVELSNKRSQARKKSFDKSLSEQNTHSLDGDGDGDYIYNNNIEELEKIWKSLSPKLRQRSSKPKTLERFKKLTPEDQEKVLKTYPVYVEAHGEYATAFERFITNQKFNEVDMPLTEQQQEDADKKIRRSRWELAMKQGGPLYTMTLTDFNKLKEEFGEKI